MPDHRRAHRAGEVQRAGVGGHHEARAPRQLEQLAGASSGSTARPRRRTPPPRASASRSSPGPQVTSGVSPRSRRPRATAPKPTRPARACSAQPPPGFRTHELAPRPGPRPPGAPRPRPPPRPSAGSGNSRRPTALDAERRAAAPGSCRSRGPRRREEHRVLDEHARERLAPPAAAVADHARRARQPRPGRGLPQPLEVERHVVALRRAARAPPARNGPRRNARAGGAAVTRETSGLPSSSGRAAGSTTQPTS